MLELFVVLLRFGLKILLSEIVPDCRMAKEYCGQLQINRPEWITFRSGKNSASKISDEWIFRRS